MNLRRTGRMRPAILVLTLFLAWLGGAWFHHHSAAAACEVCKVLQTGHSALPASGPTALAPAPTASPAHTSTPETPADRPGVLPPSRAPPLS